MRVGNQSGIVRLFRLLSGDHTLATSLHHILHKSAKSSTAAIGCQDPGESTVFCSWSGPKRTIFLNAPITRLIDRILDTSIRGLQQAEATIIAPDWRAKVFYNRLKRMSVRPPLKLQKATYFCIQRGLEMPEPLKNHKWVWYAWRVSGKINQHL